MLHLIVSFSVTKAGFLREEGRIGGFGLSPNSITSSNNNWLLKDSGQITNLMFYLMVV